MSKKANEGDFHHILRGTAAQRKSTTEHARLFMQTRVENNSHTWDGPKINMYRNAHLFVYNNMKEGFERNCILGNDAELLAWGFTKSALFDMYIDSDNGSPVIRPNIDPQKDDPPGHVYGQLFSVPTKILWALDYYETNNFAMNRAKIPIMTHGINRPDERGPIVYAWTYLGNSDYWGKHPDRLQKCELVTKNKDPYFKYYIYMKKYEDLWNKQKKVG